MGKGPRETRPSSNPISSTQTRRSHALKQAAPARKCAKRIHHQGLERLRGRPIVEQSPTATCTRRQDAKNCWLDFLVENRRTDSVRFVAIVQTNRPYQVHDVTNGNLIILVESAL